MPVEILGEPVDVVRGPNGIGTASKKSLGVPCPANKPLSNDGADGYLSSRVVRKADGNTFGTGMRRAEFWVQVYEQRRAFVGGHACEAPARSAPCWRARAHMHERTRARTHM